MRTFGTHGPVNPKENYIVTRSKETEDFIQRIKNGKYIVIFAPRQTGKTTFFQQAVDRLTKKEDLYFPIQLNVETYATLTGSDFYSGFSEDVHEAINNVFEQRGSTPPAALMQFLENAKLTNPVTTRRFFTQLGKVLAPHRVVLIIDEFDGIPQDAVQGFLHALRHIYIAGKPRCPHSVGIAGVKNIRQLNYDASISPFNIQDEFVLPNFTLAQVRELLMQYIDEVGQTFAPEVVETLHKQTAGQPFLVNRLTQILTEELGVPKTEMLTMTHFAKAHTRLLREGNTNIDHLRTNVRRDRHFETLLLKIASYDRGVPFNPDDTLIEELVTYGVIAAGTDGMCEIVNPIYQHRILQIFKPTVNGLEAEYFSEDTRADFSDYLSSTGQLEIEALLNNFQAFIARAGFRILQVPDTPQEYVGQHLLYAYLDHFVRVVGANMFLEVRTGRGRMDLIILHKQQKYIVETKIWEGDRSYQAGKQQLAAYLTLENATEGYYVVFDHRQNPEPRVGTETINTVKIRSYVIPVIQKAPSNK
ncbi:AAA family ATPase [Candidatus Poribacteria bacterium]|nr:AAA family ATPase [Candidatus Poribacteria bacterium]